MTIAAKKRIGIKKSVAKKSTVLKAPRSTKAVKSAKTSKPRATKLPTKSSTSLVTKTTKVKKAKLVRDSFTMPEAEYNVLGEAKKKCLLAGFEIKKSELLRIGVAMINALDTKKIRAAQSKLVPLKAGRPSKSK